MVQYPGSGPKRSSPDVQNLLKPPSERFRYFVDAGDDARRVPRKEIFDDEAQKVAEQLKRLHPSQLRRFYGATMSLKRQAEVDRELSGEAIRARLALLKAQAAYAYGRDPQSIPNELVLFFTRHAAAVADRDDFLCGFVPHFEAVVAYHKVFAKRN